MKRVLSELRIYISNHLVNKIPSHTLRLFYYKYIMGFDLGKGVSIFMGCTFEASRGLYIGDNTTINANCYFDTRGGIKIGSNVSVSPNCFFITADHDIDNNMLGREKPIVIEDNAWLGLGVTILPGLILKKGTVVGAKSLVTKSTEPYDFVGGTPAKFIRKRVPEIAYNTHYRPLFH